MNSSPTEDDLRRRVAELLVVRASGHLEDRTIRQHELLEGVIPIDGRIRIEV